MPELPEAGRKPGMPPDTVGDPRLVLLADKKTAQLALVPDAECTRLPANQAWREAPVAAILHFLGSAGDLRDRFECHVIAQAGPYFAVVVPRDQLLSAGRAGSSELIGHPALQAVSISRLLTHPAPSLTEAPKTRRRTQPDAAGPGTSPHRAVNLADTVGRAGRGVLLGIVDTMFDFEHAAFAGRAGASRIEWFWDVTAAAEVGAAGDVPVGRLYCSAELAGKVAVFQSRSKAIAATQGPDKPVWPLHGTAVAGLAAGHGPVRHRGVARHARLGFVGAGDQNAGRLGDSLDVIAALSHLVRHDPPMVVNMSTSDCLGPHDGSLLGERLIDELLLRPGRAVVVSAGNNGRVRRVENGVLDLAGYRYDHARVVADRDGSAALTLAYAMPFDLPDVAEIWFAAARAPRVEIAMFRGGRLPDLTIRLDRSDVVDRRRVPGMHPELECNVMAALARSGDERWCLSLFLNPPSGDGSFPAARWEIRLRGVRGTLHAWVDRNNRDVSGWYSSKPQRSWLQHTIGSPSSARRLVTVAASEIGGAPLTSGTGRGPLVGGLRKPDIAAPGSALFAPIAFEDGWDAARAGQGTSYAAPLVAGTAAVLMDRWGRHGPHATWAEISQALRRGARPAADADQSGWHAALGYGVLDAARALQPTTPRPVDVWIRRTPDDRHGEEPFVRVFLLNSPDIVIARRRDGGLAVTVTLCNRGTQVAREVRVRLFAGVAGAAAPPPSGRGGGRSPWSAQGINRPEQRIARLAAHGRADFRFLLDPAVAETCGTLLAVASCDDDAPGSSGFDALPSSCNNVALRSIARRCRPRGEEAPRFVVTGTPETDGVRLWLAGAPGRIALRGLNVSALTWRDARLFEDRRLIGHARRSFGAEGPDPLHERNLELHGEAVLDRTDIEGAARLLLRGGSADIEAAGDTLWIPRLRVAPGARLPFRVEAMEPVQRRGAAIRLSVFSDGRRSGGAEVPLSPG